MLRYLCIALTFAMAGLAALSPAIANSSSLANAVEARPALDATQRGLAAYRAGDFDAAMALLHPVALEGDRRAKRYLAYIRLDARAGDEFDPAIGVATLVEAAKAGDFAALIKLEDLRRTGIGFSPTLETMIEVERHLAEADDPVAAWRLARRYLDGDGVAASRDGAVRWLEVAAGASAAQFPKAGAAAWRLCEIYADDAVSASDVRTARKWCGQAADSGEAAAVLVLGRLARAER